MNEGKPPKAKRWSSRPRPQDPVRPEAGPAAAGGDGDYELARPATPPRPTTDDGDYELERPTADAGAGRGAGDAGGGRAAGPGPGAGHPHPGGGPDDSGDSRDTGHGAASTAAETGPTGPTDLAGSTGPTGPTGAAATAAPAGERPPHDPDPYDTPPYGHPGPWAPAPPVPHPATTPAHGTPLLPPGTPPPPPAPGTAAGAPSPAAPQPPVAPDPWRRYDPWAAASAPLQQTGAAVLSREQRRRRTRKALVGGAVLLAVVSGTAGGVVGVQLERHGGVGTVELPQAGKEPAGRDPDSVAGIAARALPSVVTLHVSGAAEEGTGTGFVLDGRGHILTNDHVVKPAGDDGEISVTFHSGATARAEVVGRDSGYDLAVVRVKGVRGFTPLPLGNSDNVRVGDPVVAIGSPFDLEGTVTYGIISAKERPITAGGGEGDGSDVSYVDALQTDAPINPGNSGGPLLDSRGRVIGINSAIRSADGGASPDGGQAGSIGLGFAIPVNQGRRVAEELINTGRATHPVIGVTLDMSYPGDGARVGTESGDGGPAVTEGGPGAKAGIRPGDVITAVDGQRVHSGEELIVKTRAHRPGDRLELTVERDGEERTVSLVLGSATGG
ncbi:protease [Streptomyces cyaneogriseus subsp. noncyanogenus]|uniref:Protease n=1 Tax=Streptomyces cyaneogriseus subsp. noncyanogenus TaxID=477245 RepID=A0A0C5GMM1_9ACTN|nr:trypsin-like peptidase domain-containing protein [Streptomyces cyaneogriseus]AJP05806.1 protease [Streptomyces cyaneogriseus subsp. noncyanogenus]